MMGWIAALAFCAGTNFATSVMNVLIGNRFGATLTFGGFVLCSALVGIRLIGV